MKLRLPFLLALLSAAVARLCATDATKALAPTSIEIWVEAYPKGASNETPAKRGAWGIQFDDMRFMQSADADTDGVNLIGADSNWGDFESEAPGLGSYLAQSITVTPGTPELPAASGTKFLTMIADLKVERYFPRAIKYHPMPDLRRGRYFRLAVQTRAQEADGITEAAICIIFKDEQNRQMQAYQGNRFPIRPDRWTQLSLEFDFDKGIPRQAAMAAPPLPMAELTALVEAQRAKYPKYDLSSRRDDGKNLALSVTKWEGRAGIPGKSFLVWAVGASWTTALGDGRRLEYAIRQRFPNAPPIVYRVSAGGGTPWNYARGWISQHVLADQPDLILIYTHGDPAMLEAMIQDIRAHSTADIIVPSLHLMAHEEAMTASMVEWFQAGFGFSLQTIRALCQKYGVEFVENRKELVAYLRGLRQKPSALLADSAHQNEHGIVRTWDNIARHISRPATFTYAPESRERRVTVALAARTTTEQVELSSGWSVAGGVARASQAGERIKVSFTGNRIDLIGCKVAGGGSVKVLIDGQPAEEAPVFLTDAIEAIPAGASKLSGVTTNDVGPHAVRLGTKLVPQTWTITLTGENGDYRLEGDVTGLDGVGDSTHPFSSWSGQIKIDPALWRYNRAEQDSKPVFGNRAGDRYRFNVYRSAVGKVRFAPAQGGLFHVALVRNLPNESHTLEVIAQGNGEVAIDSFYVYQPPGR